MPTFDEEYNLAALLAYVVLKTGKLQGRLRVQKLMYLLQQKGVPELEPFYFEYHHYGPFCSEVVDVIRGSIRSRIVQEFEQSDDDGWRRYEYLPDNKAPTYAGRVSQSTRAIVEAVLSVCGNAHWRTLELAATADFLQRAFKIDRESGFREALERKPQCRSYESAARQLLQQLDL
ncbi:hypothetical protein OV079_35505 [Nannocystis pusilla]|uniref:Antitoxin SocA-like Panacea domain-containing protein n=1 Tax=Nannocystis pusilla TaxID=889268 RepID=A0A9X3IZM5_9BACT|nr:hypothetical protein [Nannocystis pusilla]MCY1010782.1 hypothetical protein [Nannocystis pusilla]